MDFNSEAKDAACAGLCELATDLRTTSSRRDVDFGLTAENADDPLSCESPNNDDERDDTDDRADDDREDDKDDDNDELNADDREGVEDVGKYGVNRDGFNRSGKIGNGAEGDVVVGGAALKELEDVILSLRVVAVPLEVEFGKDALAPPVRPAKPRYACDPRRW